MKSARIVPGFGIACTGVVLVFRASNAILESSTASVLLKLIWKAYFN